MTLPNNKTFCSLPFIHSYIGPHHERHLCCISDSIPELTKTTILEFWNSDKLKDVRLKMIAGEAVKECHICYEYEEKGLCSLRQNSTKFDSPELIKAVETMNPDGSLNTPPTYFDHRTIHCNLQCISCGETYSSTHIKLKQEMRNIKMPTKFDYDYESLTADDIIKSLEKKECKSIYWAGGEPMASHVHWAVVDKMYELAQDPAYSDYIKQISVHYNTNMTKSVWKSKPIPDLLEFYQPSIQASIDGVEETFEYCRDGASWTNVKENWNSFYKQLNKNKQMGIAPVLSSPVLMDIDRFLNFFEQYTITLYCHKYIVNDLSYPAGAAGFLDIRLFPMNICERVINNASNRLSDSSLSGGKPAADIVQTYLKEKKSKLDFFNDTNLLTDIKRRTWYRDQFLKTPRSYGELLKIIDKEAYEWYMSL